MTAEDLLKDPSPMARDAARALRDGEFGDGMWADKLRWWCQDRGLVSGRDLTDQGKVVRDELRDINPMQSIMATPSNGEGATQPATPIKASEIKIKIEPHYQSKWDISVVWPHLEGDRLTRQRASLSFGYDYSDAPSLTITLQEYLIEARESVRHRQYEPRIVWHRSPRANDRHHQKVERLHKPPTLPVEVQSAIMATVTGLIKSRYT